MKFWEYQLSEDIINFVKTAKMLIKKRHCSNDLSFVLENKVKMVGLFKFHMYRKPFHFDDA